jgi:alpha-beta hydrolase superfamily lysophospholipase
MIESFLFGAGGPKLYGAYHRPIGQQRDIAVLLCPALGHEYVQCHFAYLAQSGFPVLRFEFRGLGNAEGSLAEAALDDFVWDVERALEELARRSGAAQLCLAGIRLGATLAALAAGCSPAVDAALLWDPVVEGKPYVAEMAARHLRFLADLPGAPAAPDNRDGLELLGFRLGAGLVRDIAEIDAARLAQCLAAKRVLLLQDIETHLEPDIEHLLGGRCRRFDRLTEPPGEPWLERPHNVFLPGKAVGAITGWLEALA